MRDTLEMKIFNMFNILFMLLLMALTLYPFTHVLFASLSNPAQYMAHRGPLFHSLGFNLEAYRLVFKNLQIVTGFFNTLVVLFSRVGLAILLTIVGAYCMSRNEAVFTPYLTLAIVFTIFFDGGLVPTYLNVKALRLTDTLGALVFPNLINTFNLIILRTAISGIPPGIEKSAMIDGAGPVRSLFQVLLPLVKPTVMVVLLYYSVETWNSWFDATIYLRNKRLFPLQLVLRDILIRNDTTSMNSGADTERLAETVQYAVMVVATVPILLVYPFLQKHFIKGVMIGAIKE